MKPWSSDEEVRLLELYLDGKSFKEIAEELDRTPISVYKKYRQLTEKPASAVKVRVLVYDVDKANKARKILSKIIKLCRNGYKKPAIAEDVLRRIYKIIDDYFAGEK